MKIALLSDLHLSLHPLPQPRTEADVVVLAGDLGRPAAAIEWAGASDEEQRMRPVVQMAAAVALLLAEQEARS